VIACRTTPSCRLVSHKCFQFKVRLPAPPPPSQSNTIAKDADRFNGDFTKFFCRFRFAPLPLISLRHRAASVNPVVEFP
jgi:hypothetical protein